MLTLAQGQRVPLSSITNQSKFIVDVGLARNGMTIDVACFSLNAEGKIGDDRYTVFFNQPKAPGGCIHQIGEGRFAVDIQALPDSIEKLVFTAAIDGPGQMSQLGDCTLSISHATAVTPLALCPFSGSIFQRQRATILLEIYRKGGIWRLSPVLQGFDDGLDALVTHFGGVVSDAPAPTAAAPASSVISLEKKVEQQAPALLSLAKKAAISLEKASLTNVKARVGLILDASGSMDGQYKRGRVQELVNRILPLAVHFDDDGELDTWAFGESTQRLNPVSMANYKDFIDTDNGGWKRWQLGPRFNCEVRAIQAAVNHYSKSADRTPVYILFLSDGGVHDNAGIKKAIVDAARLPIFWQFVGIGGRDYGILERLDDMKGRVVDNCNFFALDDLHDVSEEELYNRLMGEFPQWLKDAKAAGVLL